MEVLRNPTRGCPPFSSGVDVDYYQVIMHQDDGDDDDDNDDDDDDDNDTDVLQ